MSNSPRSRRALLSFKFTCAPCPKTPNYSVASQGTCGDQFAPRLYHRNKTRDRCRHAYNIATRAKWRLKTSRSDATHTGWLFVFNTNFLRMEEDHRYASSSRQSFDRPPPRPQKPTLAVGQLAAGVRTKASVTPGTLKAASANLARKRLHPLCRTKIPGITGRASTLHVVDRARFSAICANYAGH